MAEKKQPIRFLKMVSNLVEKLISCTLSEANETVFVKSSRLGDDCKMANLELIELLGLLAKLPLLKLLFELELELMSVFELVSKSVFIFNKVSLLVYNCCKDNCLFAIL